MPTQPSKKRSRSIVIWRQNSDGELTQRFPKEDILDDITNTAKNLHSTLKRLLPGLVVKRLRFSAEEASTHVDVRLDMEVRWARVREADPEARRVLREELIELFQKGRVNVGELDLWLPISAGHPFEYDDTDLRPEEAQGVIDALTHDVPGRYLRGWVRTHVLGMPTPPPTDHMGAPRGVMAPVPGTSAWLGYILGNTDRIHVQPGIPLSSRTWSVQCKWILEWIKDGVTPPIVKDGGASLVNGLRLCPWCGEEAHVGLIGADSGFGAGCTNNRCVVAPLAKASTREEAIKRWNDQVRFQDAK